MIVKIQGQLNAICQRIRESSHELLVATSRRACRHALWPPGRARAVRGPCAGRAGGGADGSAFTAWATQSVRNGNR